MISYYSLSALSNALTSAATTLLILFFGKKTRLNYLFCLFTFTIAGWSFTYFVWQISDNYSSALFWTRTLNLLAIYIPTTFFHVTIYLIGQNEKFKTHLFVAYLISFAFSLCAYSPLFIINVEQALFFKFWPKPGLIYHFYVGYYIIIIPTILLLLRKHFSNLPEKQSKSFKLFYYGTAIGFLGGATNFLLFYDIPIPPVFNIFVTFYVLLATYAIFRYQLISLNIIIEKGLVYSILITLISLFYLLLIFTAERLFQNIYGYRSFSLSIFIAVLLGLIFVPLRNYIQRLIDRLLYKGSTSEIAHKVELLEREVAEKEKFKAVATLASGMSHEIKNPLTAIKTFSEYLPKKMDDKEFLMKFSKIVSHEVKRIDSIVNQLLDFSKPAPLQRKKTDIHLLIDETLDFLNSKFITKHIEIVRNYTTPNTQNPTPNTYINIDPNQIRQVLLNLFLNAIDAMDPNGTLTVTTNADKEKQTYELRINDSGCGIPKEKLRQIFDPFYTQKDHGTGLGLAITKSIIDDHQGTINVESEPTLGTTFIIKFQI